MAAETSSGDLSPIRVVHVIVHLSAGGAELMMKRLLLAQRDDPRFVHSVISMRGLGSVGPDLKAAGIPVRALGIDTPWQALTRLPTLIWWVRRARPSVVQTWMYHADLIGGMAARMAGCTAVAWNVRIAEIGAGMGVSRVTSGIMRLCAALSRIVPRRIVYVARSARMVHERAGYADDRGIEIPNGYRMPELDAGVRTALLRELELGEDAILVGSAGRFNDQKDHRGFIEACAAIAHDCETAHFVMFGAGVDRANPSLSRWVAATGFADRFHLMGERPDFADTCQALDIFCLHSLSEGFPNVVAESMAAQVPCVVTDVGDAALLVDDTGWVVPPRNGERLAEALREAISLDKSRRQEMGARARERIAGSYSLAAISDRYADLYLAMSANAPPARSTDAGT